MGILVLLHVTVSVVWPTDRYCVLGPLKICPMYQKAGLVGRN